MICWDLSEIGRRMNMYLTQAQTWKKNENVFDKKAQNWKKNEYVFDSSSKLEEE